MGDRVTIAEVRELEERCRDGTAPESLMRLALRVARDFLALARAAEALLDILPRTLSSYEQQRLYERARLVRASLPEGEKERTP